MTRRLSTTPRSQVRSAIRRMWLRSRERSAALKREGNCCEECGAKASRAKGREVKVQVHHHAGIPNWEHVIDVIYRHILCDPKHLEVLCEDCHDRRHR